MFREKKSQSISSQRRKKQKNQKKQKRKNKMSSKKDRRSRSRSRSSHSSHQHHQHKSHSPQNKQSSLNVSTIIPGTFEINLNTHNQRVERTNNNKINNKLLSNIISNQKKMNKILDSEEIKKAAANFKQNFTEEIKPVTMSAFLSNQQMLRKLKGKQLGGSLFCQFCELSFANQSQLIEHVQIHKKS